MLFDTYSLATINQREGDTKKLTIHSGFNIQTNRHILVKRCTPLLRHISHVPSNAQK